MTQKPPLKPQSHHPLRLKAEVAALHPQPARSCYRPSYDSPEHLYLSLSGCCSAVVPQQGQVDTWKMFSEFWKSGWLQPAFFCFWCLSLNPFFWGFRAESWLILTWRKFSLRWSSGTETPAVFFNHRLLLCSAGINGELEKNKKVVDYTLKILWFLEGKTRFGSFLVKKKKNIDYLLYLSLEVVTCKSVFILIHISHYWWYFSDILLFWII